MFSQMSDFVLIYWTHY